MKYICKDSIVPGYPLRVVETDDAGNVIAHYRGFWRPRSHNVTLYPDYIVKPGIQIRKKTIADVQLRKK